jgi:hypothetical protein
MIRLNGAFVSLWQEEWDIVRRIVPNDSLGAEKRRIELFLEGMKYRIAEVIFPEAVPDAQVTFAQNNSPSRTISLDKDSAVS